MSAEFTTEASGRHVSVNDTRLYIVERGQGFPVLVLHGGPGLDHHMFGDYLDPLGDWYRLILVDQRSQGRSDPTSPETWTIPQLAQDVADLAAALELKHYAVLGHSFGAMVALQHAVDFSGMPAASIISGGVPSARFLDAVEDNLATFEPDHLREQVSSSWAREAEAHSQRDVESLLFDQMPFHFANPLDPRIADYNARTAGSVYSPDVLRWAAENNYGEIALEDQLGDIRHPVLVMTGRYDRTTTVSAAETIAAGVPNSQLVIFEQSGHMTFVEEPQKYIRTVRTFLDNTTG